MSVYYNENILKSAKFKRGRYGIRQGSSDTPKICGLYKTPLDHFNNTIKEINGEYRKEEEDPSCMHGNICEPLIANMYKQITGNLLKPSHFWEHEDKNLAIHYGCVPDGEIFIDNKFEGILEIKAPYSNMYLEPPLGHICQMMFQMWITKKRWCDYMAVKLNHDKPEEDIKKTPPVLLLRIYYSEEYVEEWMKPRLFYFSECLMSYITITQEFIGQMRTNDISNLVIRDIEPQFELFCSKPPPAVSIVQKYKVPNNVY